MSNKRSFNINTLALIALLAAVTLQQCPNNDPYCSFCMGSQCVGCNGASLVNGICVASAITTTAGNQTTTTTTGGVTTTTTTNINCLTYATNGTCLTCALGSYLSNGVCAVNPVVGCAVYSMAGGCTGCFNNVRAISGNCGNNGTNGINCTDKNCDVCTTAGTCQYCGRGYVLETTNSTCMPYRAGYYGCLNVNAGVCTACRYGFYYRDNNCTGSSLIWTNSSTGFGVAVANSTTVRNGISRTAASLLFGTFVAFLFA